MAERIILPGSVRPNGGVAQTRVADSRADERLTVTVVVRDNGSGASPEDITKVEAFAKQHNLVVLDTSEEKRTVRLNGEVKDMNPAFGVTLIQANIGDNVCRTHTQPVSVPSELGDVVVAVFGLDNCPVATPHFRVQEASPVISPRASYSYTPPQVAMAYGLPRNQSGPQTCAAIVSLGGGYKTSDITSYFAALGLPAPTMTFVSVDGATNRPGDAADVENLLDIMVSAAVYAYMTGQGLKVAFYGAPNTDAGFYNAIKTASTDTVNNPCVGSISWGAPESQWSPSSLTQYAQAFVDSRIPWFAASGDNGSTDGVNDGKQHVDFPAAAPAATACGGTNLAATGATIASETVWGGGMSGGATGGGVSSVFAKPPYQNGVNAPTRAVPDISGNADPSTGWIIRVNGRNQVIGGTSAVSPMMAGIVAAAQGVRLKAGLPLLGSINSLIYSTPAAWRDIKTGSNGAYQASVGFDYCTGFGTPTLSAFNLLAGIGTTPIPPTPIPVVYDEMALFSNGVQLVRYRLVRE